MSGLLIPTPSQTVGPYFAYGLTARQYGYAFDQLADHRIARPDTPGTRVVVVGRVLDGAGAAVDDALVEVWQADASGRHAGAAAFADPTAFHGFGRCGTGSDADLSFRFETVKPGGHDGQAPHLDVTVFARGLLLHLHTRVYFPDEAAANGADPVLALVPEARRRTLVARSEASGRYRFDIVLQGEDETVFFEI